MARAWNSSPSRDSRCVRPRPRTMEISTERWEKTVTISSSVQCRLLPREGARVVVHEPSPSDPLLADLRNVGQLTLCRAVVGVYLEAPAIQRFCLVEATELGQRVTLAAQHLAQLHVLVLIRREG